MKKQKNNKMLAIAAVIGVLVVAGVAVVATQGEQLQGMFRPRITVPVNTRPVTTTPRIVIPTVPSESPEEVDTSNTRRIITPQLRSAALNVSAAHVSTSDLRLGDLDTRVLGFTLRAPSTNSNDVSFSDENYIDIELDGSYSNGWRFLCSLADDNGSYYSVSHDFLDKRRFFFSRSDLKLSPGEEKTLYVECNTQFLNHPEDRLVASLESAADVMTWNDGITSSKTGAGLTAVPSRITGPTFYGPEN